jgi:uncharacterized protein (TIGR03067 family)
MGNAMRAAFAVFLVLGLAASADESKEDATKAEMKKLEGVWEGYAVDGKGERPDQGPVHFRLTISQTKMSAINLGDKDKDMGNGVFKLDLSKATKEMDATGVVLPGKQERTYLGIYELDGDTLKWCVTMRKGERPIEFRTQKGSFLLILKRKK